MFQVSHPKKATKLYLFVELTSWWGKKINKYVLRQTIHLYLETDKSSEGKKKVQSAFGKGF